MFQIAARHQAVPVHLTVETELHLFLTPALGAVEWTDSLPSRSNSGQCTVVPIEYEARETTSGLTEVGWVSGAAEVGWVSGAAEVGWVSGAARNLGEALSRLLEIPARNVQPVEQPTAAPVLSNRHCAL